MGSSHACLPLHARNSDFFLRCFSKKSALRDSCPGSWSAHDLPLCQLVSTLPSSNNICFTIKSLTSLQATDKGAWILACWGPSKVNIIFQGGMGAETWLKATRLVRNRALTRISTWDSGWFFLESNGSTNIPEILQGCFNSATEVISHWNRQWGSSNMQGGEG